LLGIGFSDNVIFRKQYYIRALLPNEKDNLKLYLHTGEEFADPNFDISHFQPLDQMDGGWPFKVEGTGFKGIFQIELEEVPAEE
jgi:hypothetical protein